MKKFLAMMLVLLMILGAVPGIMAESYNEGDVIWIKTGSPVYNEEGKAHTLWGNYKVTILGVKETQTLSETDSTMYEFEFANGGLGQYWLKNNGYKYVAGENLTSVDPETGETTTQTAPECSCTGIVDENLSKHADSCARKTYVKTLFEGTKAEDIYANWDNLDSDLQNDLLDMLKSYDNAKYEELVALIGGSTGDGGEEDPDVPVEDLVVDETFEFTDAPTVGIQAPTGAFAEENPVASVVKVDKVPEIEKTAVETAIAEYLSDYTVDVLSMDVMDISFANNGEEIQPQGEVYVSFDVDLVKGAEIVAIFHIGANDKAELMAIQDVVSQKTMSMTIAATSFSHYVVLQNATTYKATKMSELLAGDEQYSIVKFPVTLNDFDAVAWNTAFSNKGFLFTRGSGDNIEFGANNGSVAATQGIVETNLVNGYPVIKKNTSPARGEILFDGKEYSGYGKTTHNNVGFEFIYDKETGDYTYNSGANHAQYNSANNTVELYADTMSPYNYKYELLGSITEGNSTTSVTDEKSTIEDRYNKKVTVVTGGANTAKFTIYDSNMPSLNSNNYTHLNLRLRSSVDGTLKCRVFYQSEDSLPEKYNSSNTDFDDYEVNVKKDEWADIVFGEFDENKTVRFVRFYLNGAPKGATIEIASAGFLRTSGKDYTGEIGHGSVNYAGLYPFNVDIKDSYAGSEKFDIDVWEDRLLSGENEELYSTRTMYNEAYSSHALSDEYVYFAMAMEVDFYIPEDGKVNVNGVAQDIVFNFNGDDDMWVFVDGELALDIGGAHTYVDGTINFTSGATVVEKARTITDNDDSKTIGTSENNRTGTLSETQTKRGTYHKMQIFYMERAGTNSNCLIKFNLPVVPTGNVEVSKEVEIENGDAPLDAFDFTINVDGNAYANQDFTIVENGETVSTSKTTATGGFKLEDGQKAVFNAIEKNSKVVVTEATKSDLPKNVLYKGTDVVVSDNAVNKDINGLTAQCNMPNITSDQNENVTITFDYTNKYKVSTTLTIAKEVTGIFAPEHSYMFEITNPENEKMTVVLRQQNFNSGKASVTIKDLPAGNYTVKELADWAWRDEFAEVTAAVDKETNVFEDTGIEFDLTYQGETLTFTNKYDNIYWLGDDCAVENKWTGNEFVDASDIYNEQ